MNADRIVALRTPNDQAVRPDSRRGFAHGIRTWNFPMRSTRDFFPASRATRGDRRLRFQPVVSNLSSIPSAPALRSDATDRCNAVAKIEEIED
jgi:hypothetical protein